MTPTEEEYGTRTEYETSTMTGSTQPLGEKSPAELEAEINQIRAEMDSTLSAIERRFSAEDLVDRVLHSLKGGPQEFALNLGRTIRDHPIPATLVTIGLGWLFLSEAGATAAAGEKTGELRKSGRAVASRTRERMQQASSAISERLHRTGERLHRSGERMQSIGERARGTRQRFAHKAEEARERAQRTRGDFRSMMEEQPLLVAGMGIAVGVICGILLPMARKERQVLGKKGVEVRTRAREFAEEQAEKAKQIAGAAAEAAREETERQLH